MATSKPTIVILPGGYHSPSHYQELIEQLHRANYSTRSSVLPTVNAQNPFAADPATDVAFIREKLLVPVFEAGEDVLLVMHSYSGIPGSVVAKGWSKSERRARGQTGGILGLVFIASVPLHEGESIFTKADGHSVSLAAFDVRHLSFSRSILKLRFYVFKIISRLADVKFCASFIMLHLTCSLLLLHARSKKLAHQPYRTLFPPFIMMFRNPEPLKQRPHYCLIPCRCLPGKAPRPRGQILFMQVDAFISAACKISQRRWPGRTTCSRKPGWIGTSAIWSRAIARS